MPLSAEEQNARKEVAQEYAARRDAWHKYFKRWFAVYYVLGTLLLICSATAASAKQLSITEFWSAVFSWLVVILTAVIGFYKPDERASRHRQAWSLLGVQLSRFLYDQTYALNDVIRAYEQGEAIIHQTPAAPHPPQRSLQNP
jgi:hypothetical protein